jgi:hypothetical protein
MNINNYSMSTILTPSDEQMSVIQAIKDGYNVQVDAVAGSGKTTTVLSLADQNSDKIIIQLTYNSELKEEVVQKKLKYNETMYLDNLSIYTYHSLAYQFYSTEAKTDIGINKIVSSNLAPRRKLPNIDILVLDEIQDMNELYYKFVNKFIRDLNKNIQLLILGDKYQGLYEFKGADTRFLTLAYKLWPCSTFEFKRLELNTSYRVTNSISKFVNNVMLGESRIQAQKKGENIYYIRHTNPFDCAKIIAFKLSEQILAGNLRPDDIFILAASVKSDSSPLKLIENILVRNGIPCYIPMNETSSINREVIKNKVIFASFHQSKGRERKMVIVQGFDNDYFKYFNRDSPTTNCPSTLYVAATRSTSTLILIETSEPLEFLKVSHTQMIQSNYITFEGVPLGIMNNAPPSKKKADIPIIKTSPTELIKFMDETLLMKISELMEELFDTDNLSFPLNEVKLQTDIQTNYGEHHLCEEVFDINGLMIPALFEETYSPYKTSSIKSFIQDYYAKNMLKNSNMFYINRIKQIDFENMTIQDHLKMVTLYISIQEKLMFKVAQITHYNWLEEKDISKIFTNMKRHITCPEELEYERTIIEYKPESENETHMYCKIDEFIKTHVTTDKKMRFKARIDAITPTTIWEFKCTDALEIEHLLQVIIYAWLWQQSCYEICGPRIFKIMNIRTSEVQTLKYNEEVVNQIMIMILKSKYNVRTTMDDDAFIEKCLRD